MDSKLTPKDSMYDKFVSSFLKETQWTYMKKLYEVSAPTTASGFFQISVSIDNVKHILIYFKNLTEITMAIGMLKVFHI